MKIWGNGFFNKKTGHSGKQKEDKEKGQRDQAYLDFINLTALPDIRSGKIWCLYDVYTVFVMEQARDVKLQTALHGKTDGTARCTAVPCIAVK